jgi:CheY-like chemotaxis protein
MAPVPRIRPRFVVLEAGDALQRLLARYLDGTEIVPVASLREALQELSHVPAQALLVNDTSVSAVLQRLHKSEALPSGIPVIACSIPGVYEAAGALGVSAYLVKPISRDTLLSALDRLKLSGNTVLVVDDEPEALRLFRRMLVSSEPGYRVLSAMDGRQAMTILREQRPDVVLLDLIMPNMDGFQLLAAKSQDLTLSDIPVVVISARDPAGQPIVSNALAVTQGDGFSMHRLLTCIEAISGILSTTGQVDDPMPTEALSD